MILFIQHSLNDKIIEMESRLVIARAYGGDGGRKEVGMAVGAQREGSLWRGSCPVS